MNSISFNKTILIIVIIIIVFIGLAIQFESTREGTETYIIEHDKTKNYEFAFLDVSRNIWLFNIKNWTAKKVSSSSDAESLIAWLPSKQMIIYQTTNTINISTRWDGIDTGGYLLNHEYKILNVSNNTVTSMNKLFDIDIIEGLSVLPSGKIVFSSGGLQKSADGFRVIDDNSVRSSIYITNAEWMKFSKVTESLDQKMRGNVGIWSPNELFIAFEYGRGYGTMPTLTLYSVHEKSFSNIGIGSDLKWLSDSKIVFNSGNAPATAFVMQDLVSMNKKVIIDKYAYDHTLSKADKTIIYSTHKGDGKSGGPEVLYEYLIDDATSKEINFNGKGGIRNLKSDGKGVFSFVDFGLLHGTKYYVYYQESAHEIPLAKLDLIWGK